jgi:hypothetical protein
MFDKIAKQLSMQTLGKGKSDFTITETEFDNFCKEFLFEELKGEVTLGEAFCKKYNETNYVLSSLRNNKSAEKHIRIFYVK